MRRISICAISTALLQPFSMQARMYPILQLWIFDPGYDDYVMPPGYLSSKLLDNLLAWISLSEGPHVKQIDVSGLALTTECLSCLRPAP